MRKTISVILTLMLIIGAFSTLQRTAMAQGGRPEWTPGDYWEYSGLGNLTGQPSNILFRFDMIDRVNLTINGTRFDTYRCNTVISMSGPYPVSGTGYVYFLVPDLSTVKMAMILAGFDFEVTYLPPLKSFEFPLADNKIWSSTNLMSSRFTINNMTFFDNATTTTEFSITGPVSVTTPSGTYSAFNITSHPQGMAGNTSTTYYSDAVGYIVRSESSALGGPAPVNLTLKSYNYQKSPADGGLDTGLLILVSVVVILLIAIPVVVYILRRSRKTVSEIPEGPIYGETEEEEEYTYRPPPPS